MASTETKAKTKQGEKFFPNILNLKVLNSLHKNVPREITFYKENEIYGTLI